MTVLKMHGALHLFVCAVNDAHASKMVYNFVGVSYGVPFVGRVALKLQSHQQAVPGTQLCLAASLHQTAHESRCNSPHPADR